MKNYDDVISHLVDVDIYLDDEYKVIGQGDTASWNYLMMRRGQYYCDCCGISEWEGYPLRLEVDHIDGNRENRLITNFRLLCPICHDQTDTNSAHKTESACGEKRTADDIISFCSICGVPIINKRPHRSKEAICFACQTKSFKQRVIDNCNDVVFQYNEYPIVPRNTMSALMIKLSKMTAGEIKYAMDNARTFQEFLNAVDCEYSSLSKQYKYVLSKLCCNVGGNLEHLIDLLNNRQLNDEDIFVNGSKVSATALKQHYLRQPNVAYECAICGKSEWDNLPIPLILDHINGRHSDNTYDNLRLVCGNCDTQLDSCRYKRRQIAKTIKGEKVTFGTCKECGAMLVDALPYCPKCGNIVGNYRISNNKRIVQSSNSNRNKYQCIVCGAPITKKNAKCQKCSHVDQQRCERPSRDELKDMIRTLSFSQISRQYGVSDNAIRRWCIAYGLPTKKSYIKRYSDEQWENEEWSAIEQIEKNSLSEDTDTIIELYSNGHSVSDIAKQVNHCDKEIAKLLRKHGYQIKSSADISSERNGTIMMLPEQIIFDSARKAAEYIAEEQNVAAKHSTISAHIRACANGKRNSAYRHGWIKPDGI